MTIEDTKHKVRYYDPYKEVWWSYNYVKIQKGLKKEKVNGKEKGKDRRGGKS